MKTAARWHKKGEADRDPRVRLVAALKAARKRLTVQELAVAIKRSDATTLQMLYALFEDEVVDRRVISPPNISRKRFNWGLTGKPIPADPSITGRAPSDKFDCRVLGEALGMATLPPAAVNARVIIEGKRV